ncbi:MAG TPA: hypothetical protein VIY49_11945 [Bryobacteraceae bacterium]
MKLSIIPSVFASAGVLATVLSLAPSPGFAQSARNGAQPSSQTPRAQAGPGGGMLIGPEGDKEAVPPPSGPTPRLSSGKPDLTGIWFAPKTIRGEPPSMTPWAEQILKSRNSKDDPEAHCLPAGVPRMTPYPYKFVQIPTLLIMLFEANIHSYRQVFTDGRKHPDDPDPTWYGDSIGSWDGDTLVVDTIGFNDKFWFDFAGHPHTEDLHITERYQRPDLGHLQIQITIVDPKAYTKPWIINRVSNLATNWEIHEYICNEFNVDTEHIVGR